MPQKRPPARHAATTILRRHGAFALPHLVRLIRQMEAEGGSDQRWWHDVLDAVWSLSADPPGARTLH